MKSELINERLFEQLEAEGREIVYNKRNGKKVRAKIIDPIKKLYEKGYISIAECKSADLYSMDFELSLCANYAQAVSNGLAPGTSEFSFEDKRLQASKRVNDIKMLVKHLSSYRKRKLRKKLAELYGDQNLTTYEKVLKYVFEKRLKIRRVEERTGINYVIIEARSKEISKLIHNYYEN